MSASFPLEAEIRRRIALAGPMAVAQYMALCLTHAEHGYYTTHDPFGARGDFVTAPEISQMFGELIGLWAAAAWRSMDSPEQVRLVELGPGHGTMMLDVLRAARVIPDFRAAILLHMIEISPALERLQRAALIATDVPVSWHRSIDEIPDGPQIVLANEFFDALQAVRGHEFADPLATPGGADLTAHVDFQALAQAAGGMGARVHGPVSQGDFLRRLGIEQRASALKAAGPPEHAAAIDAGLQRLTNEERTGMGRLMKAMALSSPDISTLPGFEL